MAIENRVKPSSRMAQTIQERRNLILIVLAVIVGIAAVGFGGYKVWQIVKPDPNKNLPTDVVAVRTMLSSKTNYDGTWVADKDGLFEVYLPGEKLDKNRDYESMAVVANRYAEYKDTLIDAYGVFKAKQDVDIKIDADPFFIMDTVREPILGDIAKACGGTAPSGAYDIEYVTLEDGRMAMKLKGDVQMVAMVKTSPDAEAEQDTIIYPMIAYVTIEGNTPVATWCAYDSFDQTAADSAEEKLLQVANTVWRTKVSDSSIVTDEIDEDASID